ncbi:MAG: hypothetical protein VKJ64_18990 [Leptolyngbyaceae bacterium]|nr:hypothetical protein [Leptolyngbyaceae bacterium]
MVKAIAPLPFLPAERRSPSQNLHSQKGDRPPPAQCDRSSQFPNAIARPHLSLISGTIAL